MNTPAHAVGKYLSEKPPTTIGEDKYSKSLQPPQNGTPFLSNQDLHMSVDHLARWLRANQDRQTGPANAPKLLNPVTRAMPSKRTHTLRQGHSSPQPTRHCCKMPRNSLENHAPGNPKTPQGSV